PESEESFYRYGNLVRRLHRLFSGVDPTDPDEDDLEELAPEAMQLVTGSYLLDEVIVEFYETVAVLLEERRLRRPGQAGRAARGARGILLALGRQGAGDSAVEPPDGHVRPGRGARARPGGGGPEYGADPDGPRAGSAGAGRHRACRA